MGTPNQSLLMFNNLFHEGIPPEILLLPELCPQDPAFLSQRVLITEQTQKSSLPPAQDPGVVWNNELGQKCPQLGGHIDGICILNQCCGMIFSTEEILVLR